MKRILTEVKFNLIYQQTELLKQEDIELTFTDDAVTEIAKRILFPDLLNLKFSF